MKKYFKVRDHYHYTGKYRHAAHNICNLPDGRLREIPVFFQNGSNYNYHFIKERAKQFEVEFICLE